MSVTIKMRGGTAATWTANNPTLASNECGRETDTGKIKFGTGSTPWNSLPYFQTDPNAHSHAASEITSGTLADARVAESNVTQHEAALALSGAQITSGYLPTARLGGGSITNYYAASMLGSTIKGRSPGAAGNPEDLTASQVKTILDMQASEIDFSNGASGLSATTVQAAIDEVDAALDALSGGMPTITTLDLAGASTASFPSGGDAGDRFIIVGAHASGTTLGSTNTIVVNTNDILLAKVDSASTTNGANWHLIDTTDKVVSVAGKTGAVTLAAADIVSGTFANARISSASVEQYEANLEIAWGQLTEVPPTFPAGAHTLGSHSDVTITSIASGEILKWNGSAWINNTLAEAGIAATSHTHAASAITSGTLDNARVAASNVTQHQAALSIAGSQLTGTIDGGTP